MQAARADVFRAFVHAKSEASDFFECFFGELQFYAFGFEQRRVLLDQRRLGLSENTDEIFHGERLQFHANGKTPLQLGNQVAGFGDVKSSGGDEQNVVGANHAVAAVYSRAFNDRQNVALHTFAGNIGSVTALATGDLVDLVEKNYP